MNGCARTSADGRVLFVLGPGSPLGRLVFMRWQTMIIRPHNWGGVRSHFRAPRVGLAMNDGPEGCSGHDDSLQVSVRGSAENCEAPNDDDGRCRLRRHYITAPAPPPTRRYDVPHPFRDPCARSGNGVVYRGERSSIVDPWRPQALAASLLPSFLPTLLPPFLPSALSLLLLPLCFFLPPNRPLAHPRTGRRADGQAEGWASLDGRSSPDGGKILTVV